MKKVFSLILVVAMFTSMFTGVVFAAGKTIEIINFNEFNDAMWQIHEGETADNPTTIVIKNDIEFTGAIRAAGYKTITSDDEVTLTRSVTSTMIAVAANSTITIDGSIVFDGQYVNNEGVVATSESIIKVSGTNALLVIKDGEFINNYAPNDDAAIIAYEAGKIEMHGGKIHDNKGDWIGGVTIYNGSTLDMYDGEIYNNNSGEKGGAITVKGGTANIYGGKIYNNHANSWGGAIGVRDNGVLNIGAQDAVTGPEIYGNTSPGSGGAIRNDSTTNVYSGTVYNNSSKFGGGIANAGTLAIYGGTFHNNEAYVVDWDGGNGGAIWQWQGTLDIYGGTFSGNNAESNGGAIFGERSFNVYGGTFIENEAGQGGAIWFKDHTLNIEDGEFRNNTARDLGGAVAMRWGTLNISGGNFIANNAPSNRGGAVWLFDGTTTITGGTFTDNTSAYGCSAIHAETDKILIGGSFYSSTNNGIGFNNNSRYLTVISELTATEPMIVERNPGETALFSEDANLLAIATSKIFAASNGKFYKIGLDGVVTNEETILEIKPVETPDPNATPTPEPTATPVPTPTPIPTPTPEPTATPEPTPTPTPRPTLDPNATPAPAYVSLGLGQSFKLFPTNIDAISMDDIRNTEGLVGGDWGRIDDTNGNIAKGPYYLYNVAPDLNMGYGETNIYVAPNGEINNSSGYYGQKVANTKNAAGTYVEYIPAEGLLRGVDAEIIVTYMHINNPWSPMGLEAEITYDGGKVATVPVVGPYDTVDTSVVELINIGSYTSVESVKLITTGSADLFIPAVDFRVVNENPGTEGPDISFAQYVRPNIATSFTLPGTAAVMPTVDTESTVSINEVCPGNESIITDANGKYSDWIELYNSGSEDVDLSGYGLTDNVNKPFKWVFPEGIVIKAGEFLTVFANDNNIVTDEGEIHASFSISKGGEPIMLSTPEGGVVSIIDLPALEDDTSMGRYPDGSSVLKTMTPTFGAANSDADTTAYVKKPEFSADSGFYEEEFNLTITAPEGTTVYYTTDGSIPTVNSNQYNGEILIYNRTNEPNYWSAITYETSNFVPSVNVDKNMVIRAIAVDSAGNVSETVSRSYFVGYDMAEDFNNAAIISLTTDYDSLYGEENGIFTHTGDTTDEFKGRDWERLAHIDMFESDGSLVINQDCGIRLHGYGSRSIAQKALNIYARNEYGAKYFEHAFFDDNYSLDDGKKITQYKSLVLRSGSQNMNGTRYLDGALQSLTGDMNDTIGHKYRNAVVFINGEYWGQYYIQERISEDYIVEHYGVPEENQVLIKNHQAESDIDNVADMNLFNSEKNWLRNTDFSVEENYNLLCEKYDIKNMMTFFAANINASNRDFYNYNFALWRSREIVEGAPYQDGKWRFIMYDMDRAFLSPNEDSTYSHCDTEYVRALMSNESLKRRFVNMLCDEYSNQYQPLNVYMKLTYDAAELNTMADDLATRWGFTSVKNSLFERNTNITARPYYWHKYITDIFDLEGDWAPLSVRVNPEMGTVEVNDVKADFSDGSYSARYFNDYTQSLTAVPNSGYEFAGWEVTDGTVLTSQSASTEVLIPQTGAIVTAKFVLSTEEGSESNPYVISTAADLVAMANRVNSGDNEGYYVLGSDITLTESDTFTAIGNVTYPFNGKFNGKYYKITGITINDTTQGQGLFGYVGEDGLVKNVAVVDITVNGGKNVGGIVGNNGGTIENCYTTGSLSGASTVGGIVGNNKGGTVENCFSIANIQSESASTLSGIAGKTEDAGTISNCYSLIDPVAKIEDDSVVENTAIKTSAEFADGSVTALLNNGGSVWTQGVVHPVFSANAPEVTGTSLAIENGNVIVTTSESLNAQLIIAKYDGTRLASVKIFPITGNLTQPIPETMTGEVTAILVRDLTNVEPICPSVTK